MPSTRKLERGRELAFPTWRLAARSPSSDTACAVGLLSRRGYSSTPVRTVQAAISASFTTRGPFRTLPALPATTLGLRSLEAGRAAPLGAFPLQGALVWPLAFRGRLRERGERGLGTARSRPSVCLSGRARGRLGPLLELENVARHSGRRKVSQGAQRA
jgi:hypothetical protein